MIYQDVNTIGKCNEKTARIYDSCKKVFEIAKRDNIPTYKATDIMAEERIAAVGRIKKSIIDKSKFSIKTNQP